MADLLGEAAAPCVTYANNDTDGQLLDFWLDAWPHDVASLRVGGRTGGMVTIYDRCPDAWVPLILEAWQKAQSGVDVSGYATHKLNTHGWAATTIDRLET